MNRERKVRSNESTYKLKVDNIYVCFQIGMAVFVILLLAGGSGEAFSVGQATAFVLTGAIPLFLIEVLFYGGTYLIVKDGCMTIYYFGWLRKSVPLTQIRAVEKAEGGRGILALSRDKLRITIGDKEIFLSIKENENFTNQISKIKEI